MIALDPPPPPSLATLAPMKATAGIVNGLVTVSKVMLTAWLVFLLLTDWVL